LIVAIHCLTILLKIETASSNGVTPRAVSNETHMIGCIEAGSALFLFQNMVRES